MSPDRIGWTAIAAVGALFLLCSAAVFAHVGTSERVGDEERLSLRDESARGGGSFFLGYGRAHRGGGLHGGK